VARTWLLLVALCSFASAAHADRIPADWVPRWRTDLQFAADSLPLRHPNFFHTVSREAYRAALDSLSRRVPDLDHHQIVVELARIVAMVHDGHTRLTLPFDSTSGFFTGHSTTAQPKIPGLVFRTYPIRLGLFDDTLYVIRADSAHRELLGARVVSLGTMSTTQAMTAVEPAIQRDNDSQVRDLMPSWLVCPEILHARGVIADRERAPIVVERADGRRIEAELVPLTAAPVWLDARPGSDRPLRDRQPERNHWFTQVPGTRTVYARYRQVMDDPDESVAQFADSLFGAIEATRADRLVLDLRGNVGGDGGLNRPLVQHLIRCDRLQRPGAMWGLIDRGSFSAAVMMSADLELRTAMLLAGEKTGGHPNSYGDSRRVVLPKSGLTVRVSSLYWQLTGPQDKRDGITPHLPITMRFADWQANRDPVLEAALAKAPAGARLAGAWKGTIGWQFRRLGLSIDAALHGAKWEGTVTAVGLGTTTAPASGTRTSADEMVLHWTANGRPWSFTGRLAGERLVGLVRYDGIDYPAVLERAAVKSGS